MALSNNIQDAIKEVERAEGEWGRRWQSASMNEKPEPEAEMVWADLLEALEILEGALDRAKKAGY